MTNRTEHLYNYSASTGRIETAFFNLKEAQCTAVRTYTASDSPNPDIWLFCSQEEKTPKEPGFNIFGNQNISEDDFSKTIQAWIAETSSLQKSHVRLVLVNRGGVSLIQKILENLYTAGWFWGKNYATTTLYYRDDSKETLNKILLWEKRGRVTPSFIPSTYGKNLNDNSDGLFVGCLNPDRLESNGSALIMKVKFGNLSLLLGGKATQEEYHSLLKKESNLQSDILQVGSQIHTDKQLRSILSDVNPQYTIDSIGSAHTSSSRTSGGNITISRYLAQKEEKRPANHLPDSYHFLIDEEAKTANEPFHRISSSSSFGKIATYTYNKTGYVINLTNQPIFQTNSQGTVVFSWFETSFHPSIRTFDYSSNNSLRETTSSTVFSLENMKSSLEIYLSGSKTSIDKRLVWNSEFDSLSKVLDALSNLFHSDGLSLIRNVLVDAFEKIQSTANELQNLIKEIQEIYEKAVDAAKKLEEFGEKIIGTYYDIEYLIDNFAPQLRNALEKLKFRGLDRLREIIQLLRDYTNIRFPETGDRIRGYETEKEVRKKQQEDYDKKSKEKENNEDNTKPEPKDKPSDDTSGYMFDSVSAILSGIGVKVTASLLLEGAKIAVFSSPIAPLVIACVAAVAIFGVLRWMRSPSQKNVSSTAAPIEPPLPDPEMAILKDEIPHPDGEDFNEELLVKMIHLLLNKPDLLKIFMAQIVQDLARQSDLLINEKKIYFFIILLEEYLYLFQSHIPASNPVLSPPNLTDHPLNIVPSPQMMNPYEFDRPDFVNVDFTDNPLNNPEDRRNRDPKLSRKLKPRYKRREEEEEDEEEEEKEYEYILTDIFFNIEENLCLGVTPPLREIKKPKSPLSTLENVLGKGELSFLNQLGNSLNDISTLFDIAESIPIGQGGLINFSPELLESPTITKNKPHDENK